MGLSLLRDRDREWCLTAAGREGAFMLLLFGWKWYHFFLTSRRLRFSVCQKDQIPGAIQMWPQAHRWKM